MLHAKVVLIPAALPRVLLRPTLTNLAIGWAKARMARWNTWRAVKKSGEIHKGFCRVQNRSLFWQSIIFRAITVQPGRLPPKKRKLAVESRATRGAMITTT